MKQVILALLLLGLAVPGSAQAGKAPVVAAKQVKTVTNAFKTRVPTVPNVSSKVLKQQYALVSRSLAIAQQVHSQQVAQVLTDASLVAKDRLAVLEKLDAETAELTASLNERAMKAQAQWGERLLQERNPNFFPKKDSDIPGMLSESAKPTEYPDMSPAFFREVVSLVPEYEELPEEVNMLAVALGKKLGFMEQTITQLKEVKLAANKKIVMSETEMEKRFYRNQVKRAITEKSKRRPFKKAEKISAPDKTLKKSQLSTNKAKRATVNSTPAANTAKKDSFKRKSVFRIITTPP